MSKAIAANVEVLNPDDWPLGLGFGRKTLNTKTVKQAKRPSEVLPVCFRHNTRKDNQGHRHRRPIDPARAALNTVLRGSGDPSVCAELAAGIFDEFGIDLDGSSVRIDAIAGIEFVFQPPPGWDVPCFYEECMTWVAGRYEHVISAVVHRDQERPHMHVIVLAVANGRLCGAELSSRRNHPDAQRISFMRHMRDALDLRPDREARPAKSTVLTKLAISTGKGPKTHSAAAKSDAALERRTGAGMTDLIAHQPHSPAAQASDLIAPTSYCAALSGSLRLFAEGVAAGYFPRSPVRSVTPAPRPLETSQVAPKRAGSMSWVLPPRMATSAAALAHVESTDARGTTATRAFVVPAGLSAPVGTAA